MLLEQFWYYNSRNKDSAHELKEFFAGNYSEIKVVAHKKAIMSTQSGPHGVTLLVRPPRGHALKSWILDEIDGFMTRKLCNNLFPPPDTKWWAFIFQTSHAHCKNVNDAYIRGVQFTACIEFSSFLPPTSPSCLHAIPTIRRRFLKLSMNFSVNGNPIWHVLV